MCTAQALHQNPESSESVSPKSSPAREQLPADESALSTCCQLERQLITRLDKKDTESFTHLKKKIHLLEAELVAVQVRFPLYIYAIHTYSSFVTIPVYTHTHSLISTLHYTCCYDEIKGNQDLKICSHADSLILYMPYIHTRAHYNCVSGCTF